MKTKIMTSLTVVALLVLPTSSMAEQFWKSGKVNRILIDGSSYGKCMMQLTVALGNNCPGTWVSLDCEGKYLEKGDGDRFLNIATIAQTMDKTVSIKFDNAKKHGGFCVATRLDLLK